MKLKLTTMNAVVRISSKKQNKVRKLNAGQQREAFITNIEAVCELPNDRFMEVINYMEEKRIVFLKGV